MDISQVAKRSGLAASTLRYYDKLGLIRSLASEGSRRVFGPGVIDQLALISLGQAAGFSLDEIRGMFASGSKPSIDRRALSAKADHLDTLIEQLKAMSRGLRHAAACPMKNHADCPSFQRLLKAASAGTIAKNPLGVDRRKPAARAR